MDTPTVGLAIFISTRHNNHAEKKEYLQGELHLTESTVSQCKENFPIPFPPTFQRFPWDLHYQCKKEAQETMLSSQGLVPPQSFKMESLFIYVFLASRWPPSCLVPSNTSSVSLILSQLQSVTLGEREAVPPPPQGCFCYSMDLSGILTAPGQLGCDRESQATHEKANPGCKDRLGPCREFLIKGHAKRKSTQPHVHKRGERFSLNSGAKLFAVPSSL